MCMYNVWSPFGQDHTGSIHQASQEAKITWDSWKMRVKKKNKQTARFGYVLRNHGTGTYILQVLEKAKLYSFSPHPFSISMRVGSAPPSTPIIHCASGKPTILSTVSGHARDRWNYLFACQSTYDWFVVREKYCLVTEKVRLRSHSACWNLAETD